MGTIDLLGAYCIPVYLVGFEIMQIHMHRNSEVHSYTYPVSVLTDKDQIYIYLLLEWKKAIVKLLFLPYIYQKCITK